MMTANNSVCPPTLLTLNGIISAPPAITPPTLMAVSGVSGRQTLNAPILAQNFYPSNTHFSPNLMTSVPFSNPAALQHQLLPYIAPPSGALFSQGQTNFFSSVSFNQNGQMVIAQPQINGTANDFPQFGNIGLSGSNNASILSGFPTATVVLATPLRSDLCNTSTASSVLPPCFSFNGINGTSICAGLSQNCASSAISFSTPSIVPIITTNGSNSNISAATASTSVFSSSVSTIVAVSRIPNQNEIAGPITLKSKLELHCAKPIQMVSSSSSSPSNSNINALESAEFHRSFILEAIDKLRERKARPDFERISCLLKRQHSIPPNETQVCLGRLAETGAVVCVDYKGNLSYRNPSKWRKTATSYLGVMNLPSISRRIVDSLRSLTASLSTCDETQVSQNPSGFTIFQIERALQNQNSLISSTGPISSTTSTSILEADCRQTNSLVDSSLCTDLNGPALRICLEREATYGKIAKLPDGSYILDEFCQRKRSLGGMGLGASLNSSLFFNKKPLPPNGSSLYSPNGKSTSSLTTFGKPAIAPAIDQNRRSPLSKLSNMLYIAPGIGGKNMLHRRPLNPGKRGRPPGAKARRIPITSAQTPILPAPSENEFSPEKRIKMENNSSSGKSIATNGITALVPLCSDPILMSTSPSLSLTMPVFNCQGGVLSTSVSAPSLMMFPSHPSNNIYNPYGANTNGLPVSGVFALNGDGSVSFQENEIAITDVSYCLNQQQQMIEHQSQHALLNVNQDVLLQNPLNPSSLILSVGDACCRCRRAETAEEPFLVCKDCGIQAHPTCLDFWPELTERARQEAWQCADCKSCCVCMDNTSETIVLICDACDKGYHGACHNPSLETTAANRNMPWICSKCEAEGYRVQPTQHTFPGFQTYSETCISHEEVIDVTSLPLPMEETNPSHNCPLDNQMTDDASSNSDEPRVISTIEEIGEINSPGNFVAKSFNTASPLMSKKELSSCKSPYPLDFYETTNISKSPLQSASFAASHEFSSKLDKDSIHTAPSPSEKENIISCQKPSASLTTGAISDTNSVSLIGTETRAILTDIGSHRPISRSINVKSWTVDDVSNWLIEHGFEKEAGVFSEQEIDGACLTLMRGIDILTDLGIKLGPAVKIYERIKRLQSNCLTPDH